MKKTNDIQTNFKASDIILLSEAFPDLKIIADCNNLKLTNARHYNKVVAYYKKGVKNISKN
jgi:hypothetical protein